MALIEVDADQFAALQREHAAAKPSKVLLDKLAANTETRRSVLQMVKKLSPETPIPELDANQPVLDEVAKERDARLALEKRLADKEAAEEKARLDARVSGQIEEGRGFLAKRGYSTEKIAKIEELMNSRGLADYEAAEALFAQAQPVETPMLQSGYDRHWNMAQPDEGDADHELLMQGGRKMSGARKFVDKQINSVLRELRSGNSRHAF